MFFIVQTSELVMKKIVFCSPGADLGGAQGADAPPPGIRPSTDPKNPPFELF